jgi:hypothetical protein
VRLAAAAIAAALLAGAFCAPLVADAQGMILFVEIGQNNPDPVRPSRAVDNLRDLTDALRRCWSPPPIEAGAGPVDVTFTISFKRSGELFGKPKIVTFVQKIMPELRDRYYQAVAEALERCSQMPFTEQMGGAVAGRAFRVNFLDRRNSKRAGNTWLTTTTR